MLVRQGFGTLLPVEVRTRRFRNGITHDYQASVFGAYFFVAFDVGQPSWRRIHSTYGVKRLFSTTPEYPVPLPEHTMQSLLDCTEQPEQKSEVQLIKPGLRARVRRGPLAQASEEIVGICEIAEGTRITILIEILSGSIHATFDAGDLELVKEPA